jgi:hypothetical protein
LHWRVGARWYLFAVGYIPAVKLSVALVHLRTSFRQPSRARRIFLHSVLRSWLGLPSRSCGLRLRISSFE